MQVVKSSDRTSVFKQRSAKPVQHYHDVLGMTMFGWVDRYRCFGGICCLRHQGRRVSHPRQMVQLQGMKDRLGGCELKGGNVWL